VLLRIAGAAACLIAAGVAAVPFEEGPVTLAQVHLAHPRDTSVSLELGLELERAGELLQAEATLLDAARLDRQYQAAWTLANFYFRRDRHDAFWLWAARAVKVNRHDLRPILRLANLRADEPRVLVSYLGNRPELLRPYLDMLIAEARFDHAQQVVDLLRAHRDPTDVVRIEAFKRLREIRSAALR